MSDRQNNNDGGSFTPFQRAEPKFRGFPEFRSNVLYCPKQFFTVVIPHSSVNCIRLVAYMLRKTLGWVDEFGDPIKERHQFTYREFEDSAGIVHSSLKKAITEALALRFIVCVKEARIQSLGIRSETAAYELCWEETSYTDVLDEFRGFYIHQGYIDRDGQNRIGRKNIPNVFFDYLIRNENRKVIRVVGTLLWYSIDWGKGGERRQPVRKALRDLVELTKLDKSNVVRALNEAEEKDYIERIERGVFDLSGRKQNSSTVYGIHWTEDYTYTPEGFAVEVLSGTERSKNATQRKASNAPKTRHNETSGTLQKRDTRSAPERSKNATQDAPKTRHKERSKNATYRITKTKITNTPISNSSADFPSPIAAAASKSIDLLVTEGFSNRDAATIAVSSSEEVIRLQIELLSSRKASRNKLGLLRRAIEENWPAPEGMLETTDVSSSEGKTFAAHFYAGYHGNSGAPATDPSVADTLAADGFVRRLLTIEPNRDSVPGLGRDFGKSVAATHREKKHGFPALQPAIRQFGDEFFSRLKAATDEKAQSRLRVAQSAHVSRMSAHYDEYLLKAFEHHEASDTELFSELLSEEEDYLKTLRENRFGLNTKDLVQRFKSREARLERFQRLLLHSESKHDVLDFWAWDKEINPNSFDEEKL